MRKRYKLIIYCFIVVIAIVLFFSLPLIANTFSFLARVTDISWLNFANIQSNQDEKNTLNVNVPVKVEPPKKEKFTGEVRALYATAHSAANPAKIDYYIDIAKKTEINGIVIDIKDSSGTVFYDSYVPEVIEFDAKKVLLKDLAGLIKKLHDNGLYVIARQVVFQDSIAAAAHPEWAVQSANGGVWRDKKGLSWLDASVKENWEYNLKITQEAISLGFDEINFDYIRFPSDGNISLMRFKNWTAADGRKSVIMKEFFQYLHENLKDEPVNLSVDLFGLTTERDDDMNIGQEIEFAGPYFDYICPMVYPSHYPSGYMNYKNPAEYPGEVVDHAIAKGVDSLKTVSDNMAKIRPWLQDFDMGAIYTAAMVRAQIDASARTGGYGFMIWDPRNDFTIAAFKKE